EEEHPSGLRGDPGHLHLRQLVHHAQHREGRDRPRGRVLAVPPVLHRQAEDPGHRWPRCPLREALRAEGRQQQV
ncbi:MAG: LSU ribosomal protein L31p @ LSU ribosomal protein L31p, zinc-dependent, partial [uncultured Nocardioidaceae bacterium]